MLLSVLMGMACIALGLVLILFRNQTADMRLNWFKQYWKWSASPSRAYTVRSQFVGGALLIALGVIWIGLVAAGQ